jgi:hypothetical protein
MILYHYTTGRCYLAIEQEGKIKCMIGKTGRKNTNKLKHGEKEQVWLSSNPDWEETANKDAINKETGKLIHLDREQTMKFDGGLFRIVIDADKVPVDTWNQWVQRGGCDSELIKFLYRFGVEKGCKPEEEWFVSYNTIPRELWEDVQMFYKGQWTSIL